MKGATENLWQHYSKNGRIVDFLGSYEYIIKASEEDLEATVTFAEAYNLCLSCENAAIAMLTAS